jgi:hypothetical protein
MSSLIDKINDWLAQETPAIAEDQGLAALSARSSFLGQDQLIANRSGLVRSGLRTYLVRWELAANGHLSLIIRCRASDIPLLKGWELAVEDSTTHAVWSASGPALNPQQQTATYLISVRNMPGRIREVRLVPLGSRP